MSELQLQILFSCIFVLSVLVSSISQIMLKKSADKTYDSRLGEYLNPRVITAYGLFFLSTIITVFAYKYVPLSSGPILDSSGYIFVAVLGYIFLKERFTKKKIIGMILILMGIALFSLGGMLPF